MKTNYFYKGSVDRLPACAEVGDIYLNLTDNKVYIYVMDNNVGTWEELCTGTGSPLYVEIMNFMDIILTDKEIKEGLLEILKKY